MAENNSDQISQNGLNIHTSEAESSLATEHTPLLHNATQRNGTTTIDEVLAGDDNDEDANSIDIDVDPNEFDLMLSKSTSFTGGLGIEAESQESPMLRSSQIHHHHKRLSRTSSPDSTRRKTSIHETIPEDDSPESPYLGGVSVKQFWFIYSAVLLTYTLSSFDSTIMVSSHPVITSYFHSSNSASWLSTAFLLTSTSFQPIFGRLSDATGRKFPYILTLSIFVLATIWCGMAQSMTSFIIARAVCGLGAGGVISMGSIITSDLIPIEIRGVYQSYLNIVYGLGSASGAALGGAIADHLGWRWEFGVQVPGLVVCLVASYFAIPSDLGLSKKHKTLKEALKVFDYKGSFLLMTTVTFFILAINLGGNVYPWTHPLIITFTIIFLMCLPTFIYTEHHATHPIMPLSLLTRNPRAGLIISNHLGAIVLNAIYFNIPLFFQAVLLESPTASGLRLVVPSLASSGIGTLTGFLITYTRDLKSPLLMGTCVSILGTILLSIMNRSLPAWCYILFLIPVSVGQGFIFPGTFMAVLAVSEQSEQAVVTTTLVLWRSLGQVLGVAISSLVVQNFLVRFLRQNVTGMDKEEIIRKVRTEVQSILTLDPVHQGEVIVSYEKALRAAFLMTLGFSILAFLCTFRLRLPMLGRRRVDG